jgi:hypothetical protein
MLRTGAVYCREEGVVSTGCEMDIACACGHQFKAWLWQSANVTTSPELLQSIVNGEINVIKCPSCGGRFHVEVPFLYHDMREKEWIWVYPLSHEKERSTIFEKVDEMWAELRDSMPPDVRQTFEEEYQVKVFFGMDALVYYLSSKLGGNGEKGRDRQAPSGDGLSSPSS